MKKNEIATTAQSVTNTPAKAALDKGAFVAALQSGIGISPLAVGVKLESEDLVNASEVMLTAYDWVEYVQGAGTAAEKDVKFTVWSVRLVDEGGNVVEGYYQGGVVLNKLAKAIEANNLYDELATYGININAHWGKTSSKTDILLIDVLM